METKGNEKELIRSKLNNSVKIFPAIFGAIGIFFVLLMIGMAGSDLFGGAGDEYRFMFVMGLVLICIAIIWLLYINKCEMAVTKNKVYGKAAFGKMVDIPIDSISAIGMSFLQTITVSSSSGRISFIGIANREEIYRIIDDLISNRNTSSRNNNINNVDELKKYKELLEQNIITKEEFEAKKKQLLNL